MEIVAAAAAVDIQRLADGIKPLIQAALERVGVEFLHIGSAPGHLCPGGIGHAGDGQPVVLDKGRQFW